MDRPATTLTSDEHTQLVHALCTNKLGIPTETLLSTIPHLDSIRSLLSEDNLYIQRFAGILRTTSKEDPFDCTYVKKCAIVLAENPEAFTKLKQEIQTLYNLLNNV